MIAIIDPGHGGPSDRGAVRGKISEADLNLRIAGEIMNLAEPLLSSHKFTLHLTRTKDETVTLEQRLQEALWLREYNICVISVHCNATDEFETKARGLEILYKSPKSKLVEILDKEIKKDKELTYRGLKERDNLFLLNELDTVCNTLILECGFLNNPYDRSLLTSRFGQSKIAGLITQTLWKYKNLF